MARKPANKRKKDTELTSRPVTDATLEDHRRDILGHARRFIRPLGVSRRKFLFLTAAILLIVVIILVSVFAALIYRYQSDSNLVYRVAQIIPYPAAKINGQLIDYDDYLFELRPLKHYVQNVSNNSQSGNEPVDFNTDEGKQKLAELKYLAMEEAKRKAVIRTLAEQNGVSVSQQELDESVQMDVSNQGGETKFVEAIEFYYGWNMNDFRRAKAARLLEQKLKPTYSNEQRQRAEKVLERLRAGEDFAAVAREVSEDPGSKEEGGDLNFFAAGAFNNQQFEDAAFKLGVGETSGIVEAPTGFHIIKVTDKRDDQVRASHILIKYSELEEVIKEQLSQATVSDYVKIPAPPPTQQAQ